jgi:hypothetical protein
MATAWAVPASSCVDDVISIERLITAESGREAWLLFMELTGWLISLAKSPKPSQQMIIIGVMLDLRPFPCNDPAVSITAKRVQAIEATLRRILKTKIISCGMASSLAGKMGFAMSATFGRVGRAKLRPIINRAYSPARAVNDNLKTCLLWWCHLLHNYTPRPVPTSLESFPTIVSYSDGEGGNGGVGAAAWIPGHERPVAVYGEVPHDIRLMWAAMAGTPGYKDIFLVEAIGPLLLLWTFPRLMRNALWIHYIDNESAEASLISGTSALPAADHITSLTWDTCARRCLMPYFDRVASKSNPVDKLSRGDRNGPWRGVIKANFPVEALMRLAMECGMGIW